MIIYREDENEKEKLLSPIFLKFKNIFFYSQIGANLFLYQVFVISYQLDCLSSLALSLYVRVFL